MRILIFVMCVSHLLFVQPTDTDRYLYCESCLTAAREIGKVLNEAPTWSRKKVVENLTKGGLCEELYKQEHLSSDKMKLACEHLFDTHGNQFQTALLNQEQHHLDIILCYEQSSACVGVKRKSFLDNKATFTNADIEALLQENKDNVRISKPIHLGLPQHRRDEM